MTIKLIFYKREVISLLKDNVDEQLIRDIISYFLSYGICDVTEDEIDTLNKYLQYKITLHQLTKVFNYE